MAESDGPLPDSPEAKGKAETYCISARLSNTSRHTRFTRWRMIPWLSLEGPLKELTCGCGWCTHFKQSDYLQGTIGKCNYGTGVFWLPLRNLMAVSFDGPAQNGGFAHSFPLDPQTWVPSKHTVILGSQEAIFCLKEGVIQLLKTRIELELLVFLVAPSHPLSFFSFLVFSGGFRLTH